jgi:hypothetical protein
MVNALIITKPDDQHAIYVKLALEKKGQRCTLMYTADLPELQKHTFTLKNKYFDWKASGVDFSATDIHQFDVVWYRRPRRPVLPNILHPDDVENAMNENIEFLKTFWQIISPQAFWVNSYSSRNMATCKLKQLEIATNVGFHVPETLMSNDPDEIKNFIQNKNSKKVIYKTFTPQVWFYEKEARLVYTKEISINQLPPDEILQLTPGIFQTKIKKEFELRVTFMGNCAVTAKIRSQEHPKGLQDWRSIPGNELLLEPFVLPPRIHNMCKILMNQLGIVFGCFDFIVTPKGKYYFLEVNEQGQFLWIEDVNPTIKILDAFSDFLISKSSNFTWEPSKNSVSSSEFDKELLFQRDKAVATHKRPTEKY